MAKRRMEALLLSRDAALADELDGLLNSLGFSVVRNAPPHRAGGKPPRMPRADAGPPLLIVDGRDYLGVCLSDSSVEAPAPPLSSLPPLPPTLLLLDAGDLDIPAGPLMADEVACLPLRAKEVRLRVRNLLGPRVYGRPDSPGPARPVAPSRGSAKAEVAAASGLRLDEERYEITLGGKPLDLAFREYELLKHLMTHPGRTFTREHLLARVWGEDYLGGTRTIDVHIRRLRIKLEAGGRELIKTVRSVGYKFTG